MKNKILILLLFSLLATGFFIGVALATVFSFTYDTATPAGSDDPAEADDRMREIKAAVQERMAVNHYWPLTGTEVSDADAGEHLNILLHAPIVSTPTVAADHGDIRIKDVNSIAELHYTDESENELQLSSMGNNLSRGQWLTSSNVAGTGSVNLIRADSNDVAVIPNNSQTATNAAPTSSTGIANKKYVDDSQADGYSPNPMTGASDSTGTVTFPNGLIWKWGKSTLDGATPTAITFAVAFPEACFQVIPCGGTNQIDTANLKTSSITKTGFTMTHPNAETIGRWFAVGR